MKKERIAILGAGNMGTALACLLAANRHPVVIWDHFPEVVHEITTAATNSRYLPGLRLPKEIRATSDPVECVRGAAMTVIAVPSPFVSPVLDAVRATLDAETIVLNAAKGIDRKTRAPIFETVCTILPGHQHCLLAGPAIANEFSRGKATQVLLASKDHMVAGAVAKLLSNDVFRAEVSDDALGASLGGILKNIYALLFGFIDATMKSNRNLEGALLTRAIGEMTTLGTAMGARRETFYGLAGLGDLVTTSLSKDSHNRRCGHLLGIGKTLTEAEAEMRLLPEGVRTVGTVCEWAAEKNIHLPIARWVQRLVSDQHPGPEALLDALSNA